MKKIAVLFLVVVLSGCKISFNGASIPPEMKTVQVEFFENTAALVVPYLSQQFTEDLKTRIRNQTSLSITPNDPHAIFTGNVTDYDVKPVAIQDNNRPTAASSRLSITVNVKYVNNLNPKQSFEQTFTRFKDFPSSQGLQDVNTERAFIKDINAQLTEDIFNRAFAQW